MPFEIIRNDITRVQADAIVNTANPRPVIGSGCDAAIHKAAGPRLLEARQQIGSIGVGQVRATPAFDLPAKFVLHAVSPVWEDGLHGEEILLRRTYENALRLAVEQGCESVAFPLLSAGNYGFPKDRALQIALSVFSAFLLQYDLQIWLVVFKSDTLALSEKLFHAVRSFVDEHYVETQLAEEYGDPEEERRLIRRLRHARRLQETIPEDAADDAPMASAALAKAAPDLQELLDKTDAGFSETLLKLIDKTGKKDSDIYKKANVDRKLFSKIRNNPDYKPSKTTALAFAIALELDLEATQDLIRRAGYTLTHSSRLDIIVEYFIRSKNYDIFDINITLFDYDQPRLGM